MDETSDTSDPNQEWVDEYEAGEKDRRRYQDKLRERITQRAEATNKTQSSAAPRPGNASTVQQAQGAQVYSISGGRGRGGNNGSGGDGTQAPPPSDGEPDERPLILLEPGKLHEARTASVSALIESGAPVYQRDGRLVQVVGIDRQSKGIERPAGAPQIVAIESSHLVALLSSVAQYRKVRIRADDKEPRYIPADPPKQLADAILSDPEPKAPRLVAFIEAPIISPDGRLFDQPGYIPELELLLTSTPLNWSRPKPNPDQRDAQSSVELIREALSTFPFDEESDFSAAVALIMSGLLRRILSSCPLFGIGAPTPATGKSLLADLVSILCTGRPAAVMSIGDDAAELEKRLGAVLIAGDNFVNVDNLSVPLKSDLLCSIATQPEVMIRVLGVSKRSKITTRALVVLTGNNLTIRGDLGRRMCSMRLNAKCERPETRKFTRDAKAYAVSHRASLIAAALTISMAYINSGRPKVDADPYGSFPEWDQMVRYPLIWAGLPDPLISAHGLRKSDPDLEAHASVLQAWVEALGAVPVTAATVVHEARNQEVLASGELGPFVHPDLHDALALAIGGRTGVFSSKTLGYWLRNHQDRPVRGLVLRNAGSRKNTALWSVGPAAAIDKNQ